jgi:hypothetical protein
VEGLNKEIVKKIREQVASATKLQSVITARDETILVKEVHLAQQKASVDTYKVRLYSKDENHRAQKLVLTTEHDAAVALLKAQIELKRKEASSERSKASLIGRDLSTANDKSNKLQVDLKKSRQGSDDFLAQLRDTKSELSKLKKELTTTKRKIVEQHELTLAHKERMKDKEIEKERIKYDKTKECNLSKLLSQERSHANTLARTEHRYEKADKSNYERHHRKTATENQKVDTAVARAAQAAANVQMAQNAGHFPNPRGVDLERVSFCCCWPRMILFLLTLSLPHRIWEKCSQGIPLCVSQL